MPNELDDLLDDIDELLNDLGETCTVKSGATSSDYSSSTGDVTHSPTSYTGIKCTRPRMKRSFEGESTRSTRMAKMIIAAKGQSFVPLQGWTVTVLGRDWTIMSAEPIPLSSIDGGWKLEVQS